MKIEFTGRQTEVPQEVRRLAEQKLAKLARLLPKLTRAHVTLSAEKHRLAAEVRAHARGLDITALETTNDARRSVAGAIDKLLRQAERQRSRRRARKGAASPRLPGGAEGLRGRPERPAPERPPLVRTRKALVQPMSLEEAALALAERGDGVVVFRDADSDRLGVLYRRRDGRLGLVEPEL